MNDNDVTQAHADMKPVELRAWGPLCTIPYDARQSVGSVTFKPGDFALVQHTALIPALEANYPFHGIPLWWRSTTETVESSPDFTPNAVDLAPSEDAMPPSV